MEKLRMTSPDLTASNVAKIAELFPGVITETVDAEGRAVRAVDFDLLRQELSNHVVDGPQERYQLDWPGKRAAMFVANAPIAKTLRPLPDESVRFESAPNMFIEGDSLEALKLLQESYLGKVDVIYVDPPYNSGADWVYEDDFAETTAEYLARSGQVDGGGARLVANTEANGRFHSDWLTMMYPRLKDETEQESLAGLEGSVKLDRTGLDLLFQVLLEWGLELTMPISVQEIAGRDVFVVEDGALVACFDEDVTSDLVRGLAEQQPLRAVFKDSGFASDDARINAEQIFKELSPATDVKAI